jgi:hypothetical protein
MMSNPSQVIVTTAPQPLHSVLGLSVHHRDFPEVWAGGRSPEEAAARLAELLSRTLDSVPCDCRRETLVRAIDDVRAFARRDGSGSAGSLSAIPRRGAGSRG